MIDKEVIIMDKKAIYSLSYGIFMLSTKLGDPVSTVQVWIFSLHVT